MSSRGSPGPRTRRMRHERRTRPLFAPRITAPPAIPGAKSASGTIAAVLFFVLFLGWAALVPLDAGVHAAGTIAVAGNRQTVQHRDGGIVTAIHVREGQHVAAGQVLVELSAPELRAAERGADQRLSDLARAARAADGRARRAARLRATGRVRRAQRPTTAKSPRRSWRFSGAEMHARSGAISAQQSVLGQRGQQLSEQQSGYVRAARRPGRAAAADRRGARRPQDDCRQGFRLDQPRPRARACPGRPPGPGSGDEGRICPGRRGHWRDPHADR